ncbi:MAG: ArnT family glycosyltransferase, partial [Myxococcota bacterium]
MSDGNGSPRSERRIAMLAFGVLCVVAVAIVGRDLDTPGLNYDEVIQAEPAVQFLLEDGRPSPLPGAQTMRLFGGWFPLMIQPYMGALKSQLLIPTFASVGPTAASLRASTLAFALLGLWFVLVFARDLLGVRVALIAGALLAVDPSFLFISRHDWGSFALAFLMRCAGLALLARGWNGRSAWRLFAGGLCFGLGVYNKIDFAVFVVAAAVALAVARPATLGESLRSRGLRPFPALLGFSLGAAPMAASAGAAITTTRNVLHRQAGGSGDWAEKANTLVATLDGSYFQRLMLSGGSFERMFEEPGVRGLFLLAVIASGVAVGVCLARDRQRGERHPAQCFVWLATLVIGLGVFATPRAVRIHHTLGVYPFPQLLVAIALVRLWGGPSARALRHVAAAVGLAAILAASVYVDVRTLDTIRESGGKGRWSDAIGAFARELAATPGAVAVSLDWGFDGPLRYEERSLSL